MKRVRTKKEPHKIIEIEDGELLDLQRWDLVAEVLDDKVILDKAPVDIPTPANVPNKPNEKKEK